MRCLGQIIASCVVLACGVLSPSAQGVTQLSPFNRLSVRQSRAQDTLHTARSLPRRSAEAAAAVPIYVELLKSAAHISHVHSHLGQQQYHQHYGSYGQYGYYYGSYTYGSSTVLPPGYGGGWPRPNYGIQQGMDLPDGPPPPPPPPPPPLPSTPPRPMVPPVPPPAPPLPPIQVDVSAQLVLTLGVDAAWLVRTKGAVDALQKNACAQLRVAALARNCYVTKITYTPAAVCLDIVLVSAPGDLPQVAAMSHALRVIQQNPLQPFGATFITQFRCRFIVMKLLRLPNLPSPPPYPPLPPAYPAIPAYPSPPAPYPPAYPAIPGYPSPPPAPPSPRPPSPPLPPPSPPPPRPPHKPPSPPAPPAPVPPPSPQPVPPSPLPPPPDGTLRLMGGPTPEAGRLEVYRSGRWGAICGARGFDFVAADVACRQMGFTSGFPLPVGSFGPYYGRYWLSTVNCQGGEAALSHCSCAKWSDTGGCSTTQAVAVTCVADVQLVHLAPQRSPCPGGQATQYAVIQNALTSDQAQEEAAKLGGWLAVFTSQAQINLIVPQLIIIGFLSEAPYWIGSGGLFASRSLPGFCLMMQPRTAQASPIGVPVTTTPCGYALQAVIEFPGTSCDPSPPAPLPPRPPSPPLPPRRRRPPPPMPPTPAYPAYPQFPFLDILPLAPSFPGAPRAPAPRPAPAPPNPTPSPPKSSFSWNLKPRPPPVPPFPWTPNYPSMPPSPRAGPYPPTYPSFPSVPPPSRP